MKQFKFGYQKTCLIEESIIETLLKRLNLEIENIKNEFNKKYDSKYAFAYTPFDETNIEKIENLVLEKKNLQPITLIVIGIGGSNLGTWAVHEAVNGKLYNDARTLRHAQGERGKIKIYFADTVDSDYINNIAQLVEQELIQNNNVIFNVISKSGTTTETIAIFEYFLNILKKYESDNFKDYIVVTTDLGSELYNYAQNINCSILTVPKNVGGRYSIFSAVGLFPLAMLGINIKELLLGARNCNLNDAAISAATLYQHYKNGINIHDTFLFSVDLENLGKWYRQLLAESVGKEFNKDQTKVNVGMTPTVSIGSTDLHSMVQLNLAGPNDKFTTFVTIEHNKTDLKVPEFKDLENMVKGIQNLKFSELMNAIVQGTQIAYQKNNRPFCTINLFNKSEYQLGQFLQFKMYEIVYLAYLLDINPFDQPNVEGYKTETKKIINKY